MNIRKVPLFEGLFHSAPPYHTGSVLENKMGWQVVRFISRNLAFKLRPMPHYNSDVEALESVKEDGIAVMADFLPTDQWEEVKKEYNLAWDNGMLKFTAYKPSEKFSMRVARLQLNEYKDMFRSTIKFIGKNKQITDLASQIVGKNLNGSMPTLTYLILEKDDNMDFDDDVENILHADVHYPTAKAFLYLNEVTRQNAPFVYAKGSHRFNTARVKYEYDMSIRWAKLRRGDTDIPEEYLEKRGNNLRNIVSSQQMKEMKLSEQYFEGKENTLIMANNIGFHRRGEFQPNTRRELLQINFRSFETSWLRKKLNS